MPCKSLKGILVLFEEEESYKRDTSKFYNSKMEKVSVIIDLLQAPLKRKSERFNVEYLRKKGSIILVASERDLYFTRVMNN